MKRLTVLFLLAVALLSAGTRYRHTYPRSREVTREFQREHPCPSTGKKYGPCPGYVKDHVVPLCKGGADATWNLQWSTIAEGKAKDKTECRK